MIGFLRGQLLETKPPFLLLDVNGVGYELEVPINTFQRLPNETEEVMIHVHLSIHDDSHRLFGFLDRKQRDLFRIFLKLNGIGPKVGLSILSTLNISDIIHCIGFEDTNMLTRVHGIGKKTAERMIIDMKDRMEEFRILSNCMSKPDLKKKMEENYVKDAVDTLIALGYKPAEANHAVLTLETKSNHRSDLIRNALKFLTKR